jgi:soluble lytic murein transglycosylase-like protein
MASQVATGWTHEPQIAEAEPPSKELNLGETIKELSDTYKVSAKLAEKIIYCESKNDPSAVRKNRTKDGEIWSEDIGYFQINSYYWRTKMKSMGWDLDNPRDNLEVGFWILKNYGSVPWNWSKSCWK